MKRFIKAIIIIRFNMQISVTFRSGTVVQVRKLLQLFTFVCNYARLHLASSASNSLFCFWIRHNFIYALPHLLNLNLNELWEEYCWNSQFADYCQLLKTRYLSLKLGETCKIIRKNSRFFKSRSYVFWIKSFDKS